MELWRALLLSGLQNEHYTFESIDDNTIKEIIENKCYKVLCQIKQIIDDEKFSDIDCFSKIEKIIYKLEEHNIFCDRHDFG